MIAENIEKIKKSIPANVTLVAVSKTKPESDIMSAYNAGQRDFGENKVQELTRKAENLPEDIRWHMIGHLQSNKVKYIAPFVSLIHSVDSIKLLHQISKEAEKAGRVIDVLIQVHIAKEESKFGFSIDDLRENFSKQQFQSIEHVRLRGLMGMATLTEDTEQIKQEFNSLFQIYNDIKNNYFKGINSFDTLSMGMSDDYTIAVSQGSTLVRVGYSIFGERDYSHK